MEKNVSKPPNKLLTFKYLGVLFLFSIIFRLCLPYDGTYDIFHHLKTGEIIVQNKIVPHQDIFSFGKTKYWVNHQWLTQVVFYLIFSKFGWGGLLIFKALISVIIFAILLAVCIKISKNFIISLVVVMLVIFTSYIWMALRAQIFTYLFLIILYWLIYEYHHKNKNYPLLVIPFLMWVWINFHGAYLLGYIFLSIYLLSEILKHLFPKLPFCLSFSPLSQMKIVYLIVIMFISFFLGFLNPNYYHAYTFPFNAFLNKDIYQVTIEWSSPKFSSPKNYSYNILLLISVLVIMVSIKKIELTSLLLILSFIFFSLSSWRFVPVFAIVISPYLAENLKGLWEKKLASKIKDPTIVFQKVLGGMLFAGIIWCGLSSYYVIKNKMWEEVINTRAPVGGINFLKVHYIPGRMFTNFAIGSYSIFELFPEYKVGIDSRFDTVYSPTYIREYLETIEGKNPEKFFDKYHINFIFVRRFHPLIGEVEKSNNWKVIYLDNRDIIYIKNTPTNKKFIENYQITEKYLEEAMSYIEKNNYHKAIPILENILSCDSTKVEAYNALGVIYIKTGKINQALNLWQKATKICPLYTAPYLNLGLAYENLGYKDKAKKCFDWMLKIEPKNKIALPERQKL